jgi:hypothetical protein
MACARWRDRYIRAMKIRLALALAASFALSACSDTDWSRSMNFVGLDDPQKAEPAQPPVVAQAVPSPAQTARASDVNPFCISVAKQDSERNAFDAATQQGVYTRSYQQCVTIFGNATPE